MKLVVTVSQIEQDSSARSIFSSIHKTMLVAVSVHRILRLCAGMNPELNLGCQSSFVGTDLFDLGKMKD